MLVMTLSLVMAGGLYFFHLAEKIKDKDADTGDSNGIVIEDKTNDVCREEKGITNILLIGTDDRKDGEGQRSMQ